ncbi:MAG: response regulator [Planctomycetes bacterium]|nr:response regulator [Planctomycetota bacterium]
MSERRGASERKARTRSGSTAPAGAPSPAGDPVNILIVDDKADKAMALESLLFDLNQNIIKARSGEEALRELLRGEFAVILLDVKMPGMDGFETAQMIRARKSSEHTPIIFITAYNDGETDMARGYALGAVDFIFSPVVPEVLRAKVAVFIDLYRMTRQVRMQGEQLRLAAEQRAVSVQMRLDSLLNRLNVGVFRTDLDGRLVEGNPAFFRLLGLASASTDVNLHDLYVNPAERDAVVAKVMAEEQVQGLAVRMRRGDGQHLWMSMTKTLIEDPPGTKLLQGLIEDVTARKEAEDVLIRKSEELARSNAELEQFAYVASHDLQEPLRMLSAYSSLLSKRYANQLDEKAQEFLGYTVEGAVRMQSLINDLLSYSRAGARDTRAQLVDFEVVLDRCLFNLQAAIQEAQATVTHDPLPKIAGDEVLLAQLIQNLVANGIKFRSQPPRIHVSASKVGEVWEFSVRDNGIGIDPEHHDRIFGIFQRLHPRDRFGGTGIGLAVCRKVVERHGGKIWLESAVGQGSTFHFTLPDRQADQLEPAQGVDHVGATSAR